MPNKAKELGKEELAEREGQYAIREQNAKELKRNESTIDDIPAYRVKIELDQDQRTRLTKQFEEEFKALIDERSSLGLTEKWASLDRQYDGEMRKNAKLSFNLHTHQSKIKVDAIARALNEAFLDSDPIVDVSPRPEMWKEQEKNAQDVCDAQAQFIDYEMDENIQPQKDMALIGLSAVKKFVGIGRLEWCYEKEKRKREECYEGKNEPVLDQQGQPVMDPQTGQPQVQNEALREFLSNYPDAEKEYPGFVKKLQDGKTIYIVVEQLETINNSAKLRNVEIENFYVRNSTNYYDGLRKAHLVAEREQMTWWELEKKQENEEFENIDALKTAQNNTPGQSGEQNSYLNRDYDVIRATTYFKMKEDDDEETKIEAWFGEIAGKDKASYSYLGCILYPYYGFDIDYIPFYVKLNNDGFYGGAKSVMSDLRDSNIAQDSILNLALHSMYIRNILTPILKEGSELERLFIENRWTDGKPLMVDPMTEDVKDAMSWITYPQINLQDFMVLGSQMQRIDSGVTGVTDAAATGRNDPSDPHAPASKTIALLNQSSINIKDYIRTFLPSFNIFISNLLQLYYQMSQEGRKFQIGKNSKAVTGKDPFNVLTRDQMVAKTNIQARASAFAFDKAQEKQENQLMYQLIATSPLAQVQPDLLYKALMVFMKSYSPTWKNFAETDLMSPEEFQARQMQTAVQAVGALVQHGEQQRVQNGQPINPTLQDLAQTVTQAQMMANNPQLAQKVQEKHGQEAPAGQ